MIDYFAFQMVASTTCSNCGNINQSESTQIYEELDVPKDNSDLNSYLDDFYNGSTSVEYRCEDGCGVKGLGIRRTTLKSTKDSAFIILIFSRAVYTEEGVRLVSDRITCTDVVDIR